MYAVLAGFICTVQINPANTLHKQQMSELPSMTVFQVPSLLQPCYER